MQVTIDGKQVDVEQGETILVAARRLGIDIPTLCFLDKEDNLSACPQANVSCLVCLVKTGNRFVPSCASKVTDGMVIESETEEVAQMRRTSLELLLSDHIETCAACGNGRKKCKLLKYAAKYKADRKRFRSVSESTSENKNKCIKCGICVSLCPDLTFTGRGFGLQAENGKRKIEGEEDTSPQTVPLPLLQQIAEACPTAALFIS
ncbi:hypothetical protein FACS189419_03510 [Planctomycetales bacterium]|nr:hypothetical protein FACS189419_03510 [Planctomycetales bacterium]